MYGTALKRFLHSIVKYRLRFPDKPILMAKFDLKSAYRRAHFSGISALQSIATSRGLTAQSGQAKPADDLAFVSLRFTFGGSPNPSEFSVLSEMIADLANVVIQHRDWNPNRLHSDFISLTGKKPILAPSSTPFAAAREMLPEWELSDYGVTEAYIDDIFTAFPLLSDDHFERGRNAALLAIDTLGRPVHPDDPLPRDPIVATKKVMAEGTPTEVLTVLGWQIDTRRLLIQLPAEKADLWDSDLKELIERGDNGLSISLSELESIQGRNVNFASIVRGAMHFMSRMYLAIKRARKHKRTRLRAEERRDLRLIRKLLSVAKKGVSLNNIVCRSPDHIGRSDAFEGGIGGYDLTSGRAWRFAVPPEDRHKKSQNFLEYLACMTQLVCMLVDCPWMEGDCFFSLGDNTSAIGWIRKSKFKPEEMAEQATHLSLARHVTWLLTELNVIQFGQWLPGMDNGVADALSRRHDMSDTDLTSLIVNSYPEQIPPGFQVSPLPPEISSWTLYWLLHTNETKASPPAISIRGTRGGDGGSISSTDANSTTTSSCGSLHSMSDISSLGPSPRKPVTTSGPCPRKDMITWLREHAGPPLTRYARPSSHLVGTTPARTRTENLRFFYDGN
jgi:hypothetical protein